MPKYQNPHLSKARLRLQDEIDLSLLGPTVWRLYRQQHMHVGMLLDIHLTAEGIPQPLAGVTETAILLAARMKLSAVATHIDISVQRLPGSYRFEFDMQDTAEATVLGAPFELSHSYRDAQVLNKLVTVMMNSPYETYLAGFIEAMSDIWFELCDEAIA